MSILFVAMSAIGIFSCGYLKFFSSAYSLFLKCNQLCHEAEEFLKIQGKESILIEKKSSIEMSDEMKFYIPNFVDVTKVQWPIIPKI